MLMAAQNSLLLGGGAGRLPQGPAGPRPCASFQDCTRPGNAVPCPSHPALCGWGACPREDNSISQLPFLRVGLRLGGRPSRPFLLELSVAHTLPASAAAGLIAFDSYESMYHLDPQI